MKLRRSTYSLSSIIGCTVFSFVFPVCGRADDIKPNGEAISPETTVSSSVVQEGPFDANVTALPAHYDGVSFKDVYNGLLAKMARKGEFETTVDYNQRIAHAKIEPLWKNLKASDAFAFVMRPEVVTRAYDADKQAMTLKHYLSGADGAFGYKELSIVEKETITGSYVGHNAFGAEKEIVKSDRQTGYLIFTENKLKPFKFITNSFLSELNFSISMRPEIAQAAKENLRILVLCQLAEPFIGSREDSVTPTITNPQEIEIKEFYIVVSPLQFWIFNQDTGQVYAKIEPRKKK